MLSLPADLTQADRRNAHRVLESIVIREKELLALRTALKSIIMREKKIRSSMQTQAAQLNEEVAKRKALEEQVASLEAKVSNVPTSAPAATGGGWGDDDDFGDLLGEPKQTSGDAGREEALQKEIAQLYSQKTEAEEAARNAQSTC